MQFFLDILGNPEKDIPHYIHVAGTSGKGSVCSFLQSMLQAEGYKTGLFVSPHPTSITERWWINNKAMSEKRFIEIVEYMMEALTVYLKTSPYDPPSFFDMTTAMGLYFFAQEHVTHAVIETGCGGRFDATNVIPYKDLAVITNIGLDHTEILGKTKLEAECLVEKSDLPYLIIRPGLVIGDSVQKNVGPRDFLLSRLRGGKPTTYFTDEFRSPVGAEELAREVARLMYSEAQGVFHISGDEVISRYDLAKRLAGEYGFEASDIIASLREEDEWSRIRPKDLSLRSKKLRMS